MSFLGPMFQDLTGNGPNSTNVQNLENRGYSQYSPTAVPALNMGAYGPDGTNQAAAAQVNQGQADQFLGGQQGLVSQLAAQAAGQGPDLAQAELQRGTQANLAGQLAAAAGQRGNQNPGAAGYALAQGTAAANQNEASQAAQMRGQQELSAEQGLGQALGQYGGQQIGLAENQAGLNQSASQFNAAQGNAMNQFNTSSAQAGNNAQQAQNEWLQNLEAQQQSNQNAAIANQALAAQNNTSNFAGKAVGGTINGLGAAAASATKSNSDDDDDDDDDEATGGVNYGDEHLVGEAGPEAIVKIPRGIDSQTGTGKMDAPPTVPPRAQARGGVDRDSGSQTHIHIHTGQVVDKPTVGAVGSSDGPVAVVPIHADGSPKTEAMKDNVRSLLEHPDFQAALKDAVEDHADTLKEALAGKAAR